MSIAASTRTPAMTTRWVKRRLSPEWSLRIGSIIVPDTPSQVMAKRRLKFRSRMDTQGHSSMPTKVGIQYARVGVG